MNDRFRFRAWNKSLKIMLHDFEFLNTYTTLGKVAKDEEFVLMQCTGLKDRNGKDIYEGDIVKLTKNDNPNMNNILGVVKYSKGYAMFFINIPNNIAWYEFCEVGKKGLTIIGNIYENPELLGENKKQLAKEELEKELGGGKIIV